jgi:hypothetical protein
MKLQAWSHEPVIVEFTYLVNLRGEKPTPSHEICVMRRYQGPIVLHCDCARTVNSVGVITVWHAPECPEIDRDA